MTILLDNAPDEAACFYANCARILVAQAEYSRWPYGSPDRWNDRGPGNGRFPGFGIIRMFYSNYPGVAASPGEATWHIRFARSCIISSTLCGVVGDGRPSSKKPVRLKLSMEQVVQEAMQRVKVKRRMRTLSQDAEDARILDVDLRLRSLGGIGNGSEIR